MKRDEEILKPSNVIKEPYVFEFLGIQKKVLRRIGSNKMGEWIIIERRNI